MQQEIGIRLVEVARELLLHFGLDPHPQVHRERDARRGEDADADEGAGDPEEVEAAGRAP